MNYYLVLEIQTSREDGQTIFQSARNFLARNENKITEEVIYEEHYHLDIEYRLTELTEEQYFSLIKTTLPVGQL